MKTEAKIRQLWDYLKIRDDELLIIQSHNLTTNSNEYIVVQMIEHKLNITTTNEIPKLNAGTPFQMISQVDSSGHHQIPSVEQLKRDEQEDY